MTSLSFRFEGFCLDPRDRRLTRDGVAVDLNARYLDALAMLVGEAGKLVSKDRFLEEVWRGVPVTDEALTQCIKTLRRQLGDDAARPRFIETVPKHGYRFIAVVEGIEGESGNRALPPQPGGAGLPFGWRQFFLLGGAGTLGAGVAGFIGGLSYGMAGASQMPGTGMGAASTLLVLLWLTLAAALMGGAGVSFGIAASYGRTPRWSILGGAFGGMLVGGAVKLFGLDAFNLLLGQSPGDITGAAEGFLLGGAVGIGAWLGSRVNGRRSLRRDVALAGLAGGIAGIIIPLLGGHLMGGSLDLLARSFPGSSLRLDQVGRLFGERGFGPTSQIVTGAIEGSLFSACISGAMGMARMKRGETA